MNLRKLNLLSNFYFTFLVCMGLVYLVFLIKLFLETAPGFVMLLVYVLDFLRNGYQAQKVDSLDLLIVTSLISVMTQLLIFILIRAVLSLLRNIKETQGFVDGLKKISIDKKLVVFSSRSVKAFTVGLFSPKIYLPENLTKIMSDLEIKAITFHEEQHCLSKDPLRGLIIGFIKQYLPSFPFKRWIFDYYKVLSELTADAYAQKKLNQKLPIVSALFKQFQENDISRMSMVGFFDSQSERIHVLISKKRINVSGPFLASLIVATTLFTGTILLKDKQVFYSCPHLNSCIESVIMPGRSLLNIHQ